MKLTGCLHWLRAWPRSYDNLIVNCYLGHTEFPTFISIRSIWTSQGAAVMSYIQCFFIDYANYDGSAIWKNSTKKSWWGQLCFCTYVNMPEKQTQAVTSCCRSSKIIRSCWKCEMFQELLQGCCLRNLPGTKCWLEDEWEVTCFIMFRVVSYRSFD